MKNLVCPQPRKTPLVFALMVAALFGTSQAQNNPNDVADHAQRPRNSVAIGPEMIRTLRILNERFGAIAKLWEQDNLEAARGEYRKILAMTNAPAHYRSYSHLRIAQSYAAEKNLSAAKAEYEKIKANAEYPPVHRYEAEEILKEMDRVAEGLPARDVMASRTKIPPVGKFAVEFFVAPTGNDSNPGTEEKPFASLEKARDAIRALKAKGGLPGPVCVHLMPGEYPGKRTLELTAADSGTEQSPIVYRAEQKGTAVLYGGARLSGWTPVSAPTVLARLPETAKGKVFQCDLKQLGIQDYGELTESGYGVPLRPQVELWCDGELQTLARWPNSGFVNVAKIIEPGSVAGKKTSAFEYLDERHARWTNTTDGWLYGYWAYCWADRSLKIRRVDPVTRRIEMDPYRLHQREGMGGAAWHKTIPYYAFNLLEELDQPGEWYLDRATGVLYFYPPSDPSKATIEINLLSKPMLNLDKVTDVRLEGLVFDLARFDCAGIYNSERCLVLGCTLKRIAGNGINIYGGRACGVLGCDLHHIGARAAAIDRGDRKTLTPAGHFIENCHFHSNRGLCAGINGVGNRVAHNLMHDCQGSAVYGVHGPIGNDHLIEYNDVRAVCLEGGGAGAGGDTGAIGCYGDPTYRVVFRYNRFSKIGIGQESANAAIRLDDVISGMIIYGNIFYRCGDSANPKGGGFGALQYNAGRDNVADNNVFIECPKVITGGFNLNNLLWEEARKKGTAANPLYLSRYPDLKHVFEKSGFNHFWRNVYWNCPLLIKPGYQVPIESFDVMDPVFYSDENPGFVDVAKEDFRLKPDATVLRRVGCRPIPVEEIGLYQDEHRATWPVDLASTNALGRENTRNENRLK
jgi:hypothetical protein